MERIDDLLNENARLRAQLSHLQSSNDKHAQQAAEPDRPVRFLDLPKDIRLIIYEYAVVPGTITLRYDAETAAQDRRYTGADGRSTASTQLFAVCKQIKDEALPLYLAKNKFIFPTLASTNDLFTFFRDYTAIYGPANSEMIRHISIAFDWQIPMATTRNDFLDFTWSRRNTVERMLYGHSYISGAQASAWAGFGRVLGQYTRLQTLEVGVERAYCPHGCCRTAGRAVEELTMAIWERTPWRMEVLGAWEAEKDLEGWVMGDDFVEAGIVIKFI